MTRSSHWPTRCKVCGKHHTEVRVSSRGYCHEHGLAVRLANNDQIASGEGPFYDHWLRRSFLAMRRELVAAEARTQPEQGVGSDPSVPTRGVESAS